MCVSFLFFVVLAASSLFALLSLFIGNVTLVEEHEIGNDDRYGQRQTQDARQSTHGTDHFTLHSHWMHVTVPYRCHSNDGPPKCIRYTFEVRWFPCIWVRVFWKTMKLKFNIWSIKIFFVKTQVDLDSFDLVIICVVCPRIFCIEIVLILRMRVLIIVNGCFWYFLKHSTSTNIRGPFLYVF